MTFEEFYKHVTGFSPFQWQSQVAKHLCDNEWYDALGTPPATGKTSFVEIWYYALYHNITSKTKRHIPLRLWYVVDRKIIVDGAAETAQNLLDKLTSVPELIPVGEAVKSHFQCETPLVVGKIRGGMDRVEKNAWLTTPNQPILVTATVDQYGSRLLFRGYGISPKVRSIHAAMTGVDALVALDEAHLSKSLRAVLNTVTKDFRLPGVPATKVVELTATNNNNSTPFPVNVNNDPALTPRLTSAKNVSFVRATGTIADALSKEAMALSEKNNVVAVICNTVNVARAVFNKLKKTEAILLMGRIRPHERTKLYDQYLGRLLAKRDRTQDKPIIVVSTQTIEVGADFDFDAMVSQAAPLDCLIQRFGRMDRLGKLGTATGVVIFKDAKDYIYGETTKKAFEWLESTYPNGCNINQVPRQTDLFAKTNHVSELTPGLLKVLAHTHPVAPVSLDGLLHGVKMKQDADFQMVYRKEINEDLLRENPAAALEWLKMKCSPRNQEILSLPIYSLYQKDGSDTDFTSDDEPGKKTDILSRPCIRYRDGVIIKIGDIVAGDLVIVPTEYGLYDQYGWSPDSDEPVEDVSAYYSHVVRLHPHWIQGFDLDNYKNPENDGTLSVDAIVKDLKANPKWFQVSDEWADANKELLQKRLKSLRKGFYKITPDGLGLYLYPKHERDTTQQQQVLAAHNGKVGLNAKEFATAVGLPDDLIATLELSGQKHDIGKADARFQEMLYYPETPKEPLAKSKGYNLRAPKRYHRGWRHELQSFSMAVEQELGSQLKDRGLFLHLVASHHGWFRNYIPMMMDDSFRPTPGSERSYFETYSEYDRNEFYRLNEKYGYWGLAYLESLLRLADWKN